MAKRVGTRKATRKAQRKTRKSSRKSSPWNQAVMRVYSELKRKNPNTKFGDALKEASKRKKAGQL